MAYSIYKSLSFLFFVWFCGFSPLVIFNYFILVFCLWWGTFLLSGLGVPVPRSFVWTIPSRRLKQRRIKFVLLEVQRDGLDMQLAANGKSYAIPLTHFLTSCLCKYIAGTLSHLKMWERKKKRSITINSDCRNKIQVFTEPKASIFFPRNTLRSLSLLGKQWWGLH